MNTHELFRRGYVLDRFLYNGFTWQSRGPAIAIRNLEQARAAARTWTARSQFHSASVWASPQQCVFNSRPVQETAFSQSAPELPAAKPVYLPGPEGTRVI